MPTILNNLSDPSAVIHAVEANMFTFWTNYGRVPGREYYEDAALLRFRTGLPFPLLNGVFRAQFAPDEVETGITRTLQHFAAHHQPMFWWTGPATRPADLGTALQAHGLSHGSEVPGMAVDLSALPDSVPTPAGFTIQPVEDATMLKPWVTVLASGNGMPDGFISDLLNLEVSRGIHQPLSTRHYLGIYQGKPVAVSALHLDAGVAGLHAVATIPEARGHGFGAAISLQPMLDARAMGYHIGTLQASNMGFPVYRRLGFTTFCQLSIYVFRGSL